MIKQILNPDLYHGKNRKSNFFEGWYFKLIDSSMEYPIAIIPGISKETNSKNSHSFIQILLGKDIKYFYKRYDVDSFSAHNSIFHVEIDNSKFSLEGLDIHIVDKDVSIKGSLKFKNIIKWPDSKLNPGSMGFYNYLNFMECYSQVCALNMKLEGNLEINGKNIDFTNGKGYIEKNWGKSFPHGWIWVQCNNFKNANGALSCSIGHIPFPLGSFRGFLVGFDVSGVFYSFTTINRSTISITEKESDVLIVLHNKNHKLTIKTKSSKSNFMLCNGPKDGGMIPLVEETLTGEVAVELKELNSNKVLFHDTGACTGIEYGGDQMRVLY